MSGFSETSSISSSFSVPSLADDADQEIISQKTGLKSEENKNDSTSMHSLSLADDTAPMDYRKMLLLKRNSTRKAWQFSDSDDSDESSSESESEIVPIDSGKHHVINGTKPHTTVSGEIAEKKDPSSLRNSVNLENQILLKISVPEQTLTKCLRVNPSDTVWMVKQRITQSLSMKLSDVLNYGLFCTHQRIFLVERKLISDYVKSISSANYELRYKSRIYSHVVRPGGDLRQLTKMQGDSKRKELMRCVRQHNIDKISKLLAKGLDPNFHASPNGETPLTSVITNFTPGVSESMSFEHISLPVIRVLILGGAHIDFRNQQGFTPLHVAVRNGNAQAVKTLLELGAPPDSFDQNDLTPLYHCSMSSSSVDCIRPLYEAGANLQCVNSQNWTILHQVCRHGRLVHLQVILDIVTARKGAEALLSMQNESGNSALHVCALYSYQQCLLTLLKNGIDKSIRNYSHQDAFEVAVVARNLNIANLIQDFSTFTDQEIALLMQQADADKGLQSIDKNVTRRHTISAASSNKTTRPSHKGLFAKNKKESSTVRQKEPEPIARPDITKFASTTDEAKMGQTQSYPLQERQSSYETTDTFNSIVPEFGQNTISTQFQMSKNQNTSPEKDAQDIDRRLSASESSVGAGSNTAFAMINEIGDVPLQSTSHPDVFHYCREVTLSKGEDGYGFVMRGAKADKSTENSSFTVRHPGQQYLESVEPGSNAHTVGLRSGDFILKINGIDVASMGHRQAVDVIRKLRDPIRIRVVSVVLKSSDSPVEETDHSVVTSSEMASSKTADGKLRRTESIGSAIGKLDSVLEDAFDDDANEVTATLRRRPISRKFRSQDIEEIFRNDGPPAPNELRSRGSKLSTNGSVSSRLVRVLPPTVPSSPPSSGPGDDVSSGGRSPTTSFDRFNSTPAPHVTNHYTMPRNAGRPQSMAADFRKAPPPPERRDSRLTSSDVNTVSRQRSSSLATQPAVSQSLGRSFGAPPGRTDLSGFASAIAVQAQQRRERALSNEGSDKVPSTPITHHLVSKAVPSVAKKPDRGKPFAPLPKVPDSPEEPKSAFAIALAAKQASLRNRSQTAPVLPQSSTAPGNTTVHNNSTQLPPPPPSIPENDSGNPILYNLPPPPPPVSQSHRLNDFDPTSLPPPPDTMLPSKTNHRNISASSNGHDNGSSADSGVDEFMSHHRHQDSKANVDNLSVVSSLSTISSEDGSDAGVSLSYDPKSGSGEQNVGNMYLDVLRKNKSHSPAAGSAMQLTKVSFTGSKPGPAKVGSAAVAQKHEPTKSAPPPTLAPKLSAPEPTASGHGGPTKPLAEWTTADVCQWLNGLGLSSYSNMFAENEIVGSHLPELSKEDLQDLGVTRVGHRLTIEKSLKKLTSN